MEFRTADDINSFFNKQGIYLVREVGGGHEFVFKTGDDPKNYLKFDRDEEARIANFIISNTINPFINFNNNNVRQYSTRVNLDVINDYLNEQEKIDKLQALHNKLMDCKYIQVNNNCYQLKFNGEIGLWLIDKGLVPITDLTEINENINIVKDAIHFNGATNPFSEEYESELAGFAKVAISDFEK